MERLEAKFADPYFSRPHDRERAALLEKEIARLQADVTRQMAASVWRGIRLTARAVGRAFSLVARAVAAQRLYEELNRLDDQTLANLGLTREAIPQYVARSIDGGPATLPDVAPATDLGTVDGGALDIPANSDDVPNRRAA